MNNNNIIHFLGNKEQIKRNIEVIENWSCFFEEFDETFESLHWTLHKVWIGHPQDSYFTVSLCFALTYQYQIPF